MLRLVDVARFGRAIRALRRRRRWRQIDLASAAGVSATQVGRIERGESRRLPADTFDRVAQAAGASLDLALRWKGEGLDRLLDEDHARLVELVVLKLQALGWEVAVEVSFSRFGERGSIDVLAFHPIRRALLVSEVKSVTPTCRQCSAGSTARGGSVQRSPATGLGSGGYVAGPRGRRYADQSTPDRGARGVHSGGASGPDA